MLVLKAFVCIFFKCSKEMSSVLSAQLSGDGDTYSHLFKVLLIGDSGVGKSSILLRFADDSFTGNHITTIGVDFKIRTLTVNNQRVKLQIWDTAGQERFRTITSTYYRGTHAVIVVYDVTNSSTLESVHRWLNEIDQYCNSVDRILVGNKNEADVNKIVSTEEGSKLASSHNIEFIEVSARDNVNIEEIFVRVTKMMLETKQKRKQAENQSKKSTNNNEIRLQSPLSRVNRSNVMSKIKLC